MYVSFEVIVIELLNVEQMIQRKPKSHGDIYNRFLAYVNSTSLPANIVTIL